MTLYVKRSSRATYSESINANNELLYLNKLMFGGSYTPPTCPYCTNSLQRKRDSSIEYYITKSSK